MFSAVSNLGAGGTQDVALSDTSNGVLYGMFAVTGLIAGGINNCELSSPFCFSRELSSKMSDTDTVDRRQIGRRD